MTGMVEGKVAVVTGGGGGIGRAACILLAREGAKVVVSDVDEALGQETAAQISAGGGDAIFQRCDVAHANEVAALVASAENRFGGLDIFVNNAGTEGQVADIAEYDEDAFDRLTAINLKGVFLGLKYASAAIRRSGKGGSIVNIASGAGLVGIPKASAYVMSKHGVIGLTKSAALDLAPDGIRVNAVCPGGIKTRMLSDMTAAYGVNSPEAMFEAVHPLGRLGQPAEVAEAIVWLASEKASFTTGAYFAVDAGYVAQ